MLELQAYWNLKVEEKEQENGIFGLRELVTLDERNQIETMMEGLKYKVINPYTEEDKKK